MKIYKEYMDEMKAPEELIQKTKEKMKEAETLQKMAQEEPEPVRIRGIADPARRKKRRYFRLAGAGLSACLVVCLAVWLSAELTSPAGDGFSELVWNTVSDDGVRAPGASADPQLAAGAPSDPDVVFSATSVPSGLGPAAIFPSFELVQERQGPGEVLFFLRKEDTSVLYQISSAADTIPQQLQETAPQEFDGMAFFLGISGDERTCYVAWQQDALWFLITAKDISEEDLSETLKTITERN